MAECPESIEELEALERLIPLCKRTLYETARAKLEAGAAHSRREAEDEFVHVPIRKDRLKYYICPKSNKPKQFITYFITDNFYIKIGKAIEVSLRIKELQAGNPNLLTATVLIKHDAERYFHRMFRKYRIRNEWFKLPENYLTLVKNACIKKNFEYQLINLNEDNND